MIASQKWVIQNYDVSMVEEIRKAVKPAVIIVSTENQGLSAENVVVDVYAYTAKGKQGVIYAVRKDFVSMLFYRLTAKFAVEVVFAYIIRLRKFANYAVVLEFAFMG